MSKKSKSSDKKSELSVFLRITTEWSTEKQISRRGTSLRERKKLIKCMKIY
jgi:hypothetical protein